MNRTYHIASLNELSASEGVFTTAQAARLGIPRSALSNSVAAGRAERVLHGAYRLAGTPAGFADELAAVWKLTSPASFTHERMGARSWDGIAVGGATAASLLGIGDFHLSPYRIFTPVRFNSRIRGARFSARRIDAGDVTWVEGLPVTRMERTLVDLCLDREDPSLVGDAFRDARARGLDLGRVEEIVSGLPARKAARDAAAVLGELAARDRGEWR